MKKFHKFIHRIHIISVCFIIITFLFSGISIAGGRKGSRLVGGVGSSHKGGHYVGGESSGSSGSSGGHYGGGSGSGSYIHYEKSSPKPKYKIKRYYRSRNIKNIHFKTSHEWHSGVQRDRDGRIMRSQSAKREFLREKGLKKIPNGMNIDHIIPLFAGGCDCPANMQLISISEHRRKTRMDYKKYHR